jgi:peroxiredoxin
MVYLQEMHESFKDKGLVVLGFNSADDTKIAEAFLEKKEVTFRNILDTSDGAKNAAYRGYRSSGVPLNYIIDRQGRVAAAWYGYRENDSRGDKVLERLGVK